MPNEKTIVVTRTFPHSREKVFQALLNPSQMSKWFFAGPGWSADIEALPKVDGEYTITMKTPEGENHIISGKYIEISEPKKLVFSWNFGPEVKDTRVTIELKETETGSELVLTHEFMPEPMHSNVIGGWQGCLNNLEIYYGLEPSFDWKQMEA